MYSILFLLLFSDRMETAKLVRRSASHSSDSDSDGSQPLIAALVDFASFLSSIRLSVDTSPLLRLTESIASELSNSDQPNRSRPVSPDVIFLGEYPSQGSVALSLSPDIIHVGEFNGSQPVPRSSSPDILFVGEFPRSHVDLHIGGSPAAQASSVATTSSTSVSSTISDTAVISSVSNNEIKVLLPDCIGVPDPIYFKGIDLSRYMVPAFVTEREIIGLTGGSGKKYPVESILDHHITECTCISGTTIRNVKFLVKWRYCRTPTWVISINLLENCRQMVIDYVNRTASAHQRQIDPVAEVVPPIQNRRRRRRRKIRYGNPYLRR